MEIKNKSAYILTPDGEFVKVKIKGNAPSIGSTYSGEPSSKLPLSRYASIAACLILFFSFGGVAYAYYTPVASLVLKTDSAIELKINRWNKIIETLPLNDDGKDILDSVNLKNKSVNEGLNLILDKADRENLIKGQSEHDKKINLAISSDKDLDLDINELENTLKDKNLQLEVNYTENHKSTNTNASTTETEKNTNKTNSNSENNKTNSNSKNDKNNNNNNNKSNNVDLKNSEKSKGNKDTKNSIKPIEKKSPANEKNKKKIIDDNPKKSSIAKKNINNKLKTKNKKTKKTSS